MPIVKVFDVQREKRKIFPVKNITLDEVKKTVQIKFGFECYKLVLEDDGAEIEEDEVLKELIESTLVALGPGEKWKAAINGDAPSTNSSPASTVQQNESQSLSSFPISEATDVTTDQQNEGRPLCSSPTSEAMDVPEGHQNESQHASDTPEDSTPDDSNTILTIEATKLKEQIKQKGLDNILPHLNEHLDRWKKEPISFAVIGSSNTGKSTFINEIRNIKPGEKGFARSSSSGDTTMDKARYKFPKNDMITIDDLPGYGTTKFPKHEYETKMKILNYDYILIFVSSISENDIEFGKLLQKNKIKFAFVRSKLDIDLQNCQRDQETKEEAITKIKAKSLAILAEENLKEVPWFGISSSDRKIGQFNSLVAHIQNSLSELKRESVILTFLGELSSDLIKNKFEQLRKRILRRSIESGLVAAVPVPGLDIAVNVGILVSEIRLYKETFGFNQTIVQERAALAEVRQRLHKNSLLLIVTDYEELASFVVTELGSLGTVMAIQSAMDPLLPILGSVLSGSVAGITTRRFLNRLLVRCRDDALVVYSHLMEHPTVDTNLGTGQPSEPETLSGGKSTSAWKWPWQ